MKNYSCNESLESWGSVGRYPTYPVKESTKTNCTPYEVHTTPEGEVYKVDVYQNPNPETIKFKTNFDLKQHPDLYSRLDALDGIEPQTGYDGFLYRYEFSKVFGSMFAFNTIRDSILSEIRLYFAEKFVVNELEKLHEEIVKRGVAIEVEIEIDFLQN